VVGVVLIVGGLVSLGLGAAGAPEALLRFLYDALLSGFDVPEDPPQTHLDIVHWFALIAGAIEALVGAVVLALAVRRGPWR
jgi:hypothetical protein